MISMTCRPSETLPGFVAGGWSSGARWHARCDRSKAGLDLRKAMDDVEVKKKLAQLGAYTHAMSPEQVNSLSINNGPGNPSQRRLRERPRNRVLASSHRQSVSARRNRMRRGQLYALVPL